MALRLIVSQRNKSMSEMDTDGTIFVGKSAKAGSFSRSRSPTAMGWSPGRPAPARPSPCRCWRRDFRARASRSSRPISRATSPAFPSWARRKEAFVSARQEPGFRLRAGPVPGRVLGPVRRAGPSGARHDLGDGAAAAVAADGSQRGAGGRAQYRFRVADEQGLLLLDLKDLRAMLGYRRASMRPNSRPNTAMCRSRPIGTIQRQLLVLENQGGSQFLRRAGAGAEGLYPHRPRRPRLHQHPGRRQADGEPAALRHLPALAACRSCSSSCPRSAIRPSPSSASSSTRRISCSPMRRRRCWTRSSRSSG